MAQPPDPVRHVTAKTRIYLPGGNHGFRPGETVPLPQSVIDTLVKAGHLDKPEETPEVAAAIATLQAAGELPAELQHEAATPAAPAG